MYRYEVWSRRVRREQLSLALEKDGKEAHYLFEQAGIEEWTQKCLQIGYLRKTVMSPLLCYFRLKNDIIIVHKPNF